MEWKGGFFWIVSNDVDKFELPFKVEGMWQLFTNTCVVF